MGIGAQGLSAKIEVNFNVENLANIGTRCYNLEGRTHTINSYLINALRTSQG